MTARKGTKPPAARPRAGATRAKARRPAKRRGRVVASAGPLTVSEVTALEDLRKELERAGSGRSPLRWNADPDEVQR